MEVLPIHVSTRLVEGQIVIDAPAKLNLGLEVIGRRDDGFHEIATIFLTIDLSDRLTLSPADDLELSCDDDSLAGTDNLALRALDLLRDATSRYRCPHFAGSWWSCQSCASRPRPLASPPALARSTSAAARGSPLRLL